VSPRQQCAVDPRRQHLDIASEKAIADYEAGYRDGLGDSAPAECDRT
jgi:hypothetical protein